MKAVGTVWKNKAGRWHARMETGAPNESYSFEVRGKKRLKDAVYAGNRWARKLGWKLDEPWIMDD